MRKEENSIEYTTMKGFLNNKILKEKLELVLILDEMQVTYRAEDRWHSNPAELFHIVNIYVKTDNGDYYKLQIQNDKSDFCSWKTVRQFVVKKVGALDLRQTGGWEAINNYGNTVQAFYEYYRPRGKGKHYVSIGEGDRKTITGKGYFEIIMEKKQMWLNTGKEMTDKIGSRKIRQEDVQKMAEDNGLESRYLFNFSL